MGYWTQLAKRNSVADRSNHPWAELLRKTLHTAKPELLATLEGNGDAEAYVNVQVDDVMRAIRAMMDGGMEYEVAKEVAFEDFLPADEEAGDIDDWEEEGGQQDAIDAFSDWVDINAEGRQEVDD